LASPYFDDDAFTHHALHVLDTPGCSFESLSVIKAKAMRLYSVIKNCC